jgi:hypothetical protein
MISGTSFSRTLKENTHSFTNGWLQSNFIIEVI